MLEYFEIRGFRCFEQATAKLRPLTVLVGANNSGKSAFLDAVLMAADPKKNWERTDFWRLDQRGDCQLVSRISDVGQITMSGTGHRTGTWPTRKGELPVRRFQLPSGGVAMESPGESDQEGSPALGNEGQGVPALFDYLLRRDRRRFDQLVESATELIPGLTNINIRTPTRDRREIWLTLENELELSGEKVSTGVRLMLFFLGLVHHPEPPQVILLEEPENGIHPRRLEDVMRLLRSLTLNSDGISPVQVILTTHSPYLLDFVDLATDQVLVFRQQPNGARTIDAVDQEGLADFLTDFKLGEVWYNQRENGMVRVQP